MEQMTVQGHTPGYGLSLTERFPLRPIDHVLPQSADGLALACRHSRVAGTLSARGHRR